MKKIIQRKYHLFDAKDKSVGRVAVEVAKVLRGKNKVDFTPHIDGGDMAVVINIEEIKVAGNKLDGKMYHHFSGYPGGIKSLTLKQVMEKNPKKVMQEAVYNMLCKNKLRDKMMNRLFVYVGSEHKHKIDIEHK